MSTSTPQHTTPASPGIPASAPTATPTAVTTKSWRSTARDLARAANEARGWRGAGIHALGATLLTVLALAVVELAGLGWPVVETVATATGAASVWLLARNRVEGWWVGLVSVVCFVVVFYQVQLYGEVAIQVFYFFTSLQAIWVWARKNEGGATRPVTNVSAKVAAATLAAFAVAWAGAWVLLDHLGGALPGWDSLTTVGSITAHMWLVFRYAQSWWIWVGLDIIYIPLYYSRGLPLTSGLYVLFLVLATQGLLRFRREVAAQKMATVDGAALAGEVT